MAKVYLVMLWDTPLAEYELDDNYQFRGMQRISDLAPVDKNALIQWLNSRTIAVERRGLQKILGNLNRYQLLDYSLGLSLNDCLWVKPKDSALRFYQVNFYDNNFDEDLGIVSMFRKNMGLAMEKFTTPELQTSGNLPKAWRTVNGRRYLFKTGNYGTPDILEIAYELPCSVIAQLFTTMIAGMSAIKYELTTWDDKFVCYSEQFTNKYISYISCSTALQWWRVFPEMSYRNLCSKYSSYKSLFDSVLVLDYLILNRDRHLNNFGFMVNSNTLILDQARIAPIYDNGRSFDFHQISKVLPDKYEHLMTNTCPILSEQCRQGIQHVMDNINVVEEAMRRSNDMASEHGGIEFYEDRTDYNMSALIKRCKALLEYN